MKNKLIFFLLFISTAVFGQSRVLYTTRAALLSGVITNEADVYIVYDTTKSFVETYIKVAGTCSTNDSTINSSKGCYRRRAVYATVAEALSSAKNIATMSLAEAKLINDATFKSIYLTDAGKRGMFTYNPSGSGTTDDVLKFKNAGNLYYEREPKGYQLVDNWGAKGDGTTDDYTTLQAAINSGVKQLKLRDNAVYKITNELSIPSNVSIEMSGSTIVQATYNKNAFNLSNVKNISITNGTIKAGYWIAYGGSFDFAKNNGVYAIDVDNVTIQNVTFRNWGSCGIQARRCESWYVNNNLFLGLYIINDAVAHSCIAFTSSFIESPAGFKGGGHVVKNNRLYSNTRIGGYANLNGGERTSLWEGNHIIPCDTLAVPLDLEDVVLLHGIAESYGYGGQDGSHIFAHNTIENCAATGLYFPGGVTNHIVGPGVTAIGNVVRNAGHGNGGLSSGIYIAGPHRYANIAHNVVDEFKATQGGAINVHQGVNTDSTDIYSALVTGNYVFNSSNYGIVGDGLYTTISSNFVFNSANTDIYWSNISNPSPKDFTHRGININNNTIRRGITNTSPAIMVRFEAETDTAELSDVFIRHNSILNVASRQGEGIRFRGFRPYIEANEIYNFDIGVYLNITLNTKKLRRPRIKDNIIDSCIDGIDYLGSASDNSSIFVVGVNEFRNVSYKYRNQTTGANEFIVEVFNVMPDGDIWFQSSSDPTNGTFQLGDRYYYPNPTTAAMGKVCTTAGTASTDAWTEF